VPKTLSGEGARTSRELLEASDGETPLGEFVPSIGDEATALAVAEALYADGLVYPTELLEAFDVDEAHRSLLETLLLSLDVTERPEFASRVQGTRVGLYGDSTVADAVREPLAAIGCPIDDTDPDLLSLVFDTGHYVYGSGAPDPEGDAALRGLQRFWDRTRYVHFKDCDPDVAVAARAQGWDYPTAVGKGIFCELGQGSVDFAGIVEFLRAHDYEDWITVEQDVLPGMGTPKESARRNREYLRGLGL
jgi:hypothetical protein